MISQGVGEGGEGGEEVSGVEEDMGSGGGTGGCAGATSGERGKKDGETELAPTKPGPQSLFSRAHLGKKSLPRDPDTHASRTSRFHSWHTTMVRGNAPSGHG